MRRSRRDSRALPADSHAGPDLPAAVNILDLSRYIAEMCGDLALMAQSARLPMLAYFLSMARHEAERTSREDS